MLSLRSRLLWPVSGRAPRIAELVTVVSVTPGAWFSPRFPGVPLGHGERQLAGCSPSTYCVLKEFAEWLPASARGGLAKGRGEMKSSIQQILRCHT